jgi:Ca2+-binding EF-hand superfamily protein
MIMRVETLIRELERCPDYSPAACYRTLDPLEEGKISATSLIEFFRKFGNYLSEPEVFAIIRRIDTDGDAKISY